MAMGIDTHEMEKSWKRKGMEREKEREIDRDREETETEIEGEREITGEILTLWLQSFFRCTEMFFKPSPNMDFFL